MLRLIVAAALGASALLAQHDMSQMSGMADMPGMPDKSDMKTPMFASGTSVNPASTHEPMIHLMSGNWMFMLHGQAFLADLQQTGPRGGDKFLSINWLMAEASHPLAGGTFAVRSMLSLEPATITDRRY